MSWETPPSFFRGLSLKNLGTDEAYLNISSSSASPFYLYTLSDDCDLCPWQRESEVGAVGRLLKKVHAHHPLRLLVRSSGSEQYIRTDSGLAEDNVICGEQSKLFGQFGVYDLDLDSCRLVTALEPVNTWLGLLVCLLVYIGLGALAFGLKKLPGQPIHKLERWLGWRDEKEATGKQRLRSLDTFRGISLAVMIFVNDGGGMYWFFEHATWNGLYVADLVFPWFLWIMGVCIPMSVRSNLKKNVGLPTVIWQITVRSVKLFLLGFILNTLGGWIDLEKLRVPGVLQRFAISYFAVALVGNLLAKVKLTGGDKTCWYTDLVDLSAHWLVMGTVLCVHQLVVWLLPAPGCPQGYRGPGGLHDWSPDRNNSGCIGGITGSIDRAFFSTAHIYGNPTAKSVYSASAFDPEGLLGSLTTIFQVWLGYQAGYILQVYPDVKDRVGRWMGWAVVTGVIGAVLCGGSQNGGWVPLNKNLWSISFVLVTSCFAFVLLSLLYLVIDVKKWWKGQPFFYAGMNSILLYCGHSVGYNLFPWHFISGDMRLHAERLPEALWGTSLWVFIAFVLYKKKVFVTV